MLRSLAKSFFALVGRSVCSFLIVGRRSVWDWRWLLSFGDSLFGTEV